MPAIATITVKPETSTARPDVARPCGPLRSCRLPPFLLAFATQVEQRVVDADRQADEQHHRAHGVVHRHELARDRDQAERRHDRGQPEQQRDAGRDERAEGEDEDDQRDRQREELGLLEVVLNDFESALLALASPNCPTKTFGLSALTLATEATTGRCACSSDRRRRGP
jgi:transposase-like protein